MPRSTFTGIGLLAVAAVGATHAYLTERQSSRANALHYEAMRQRLAVREADEAGQDPKQAALLIENSWISLVGIRYRLGLLTRRGLEWTAQYRMDTEAGRNAWTRIREARIPEAHDRRDWDVIEAYDAAHSRATLKAAA
ncbi:hypothetical protein ACIQU6_40050 [Streptomyces sp. NPDC090442]|uniref:hypothetical protein n=1 Tax=Streptomyces sp. NPDC090442 TaxID=3365962 RepID=UPI0038027CCC